MNEFEQWSDGILKGRKLPAGTRRKHGGILKEKQADGSWVPVKKRRRRKSKPAASDKKTATEKHVPAHWSAELADVSVRKPAAPADAPVRNVLPRHAVRDLREKHIEAARGLMGFVQDELVMATRKGATIPREHFAFGRWPYGKRGWERWVKAVSKYSDDAKWVAYHNGMYAYYWRGRHEKGIAPPDRPEGRDFAGEERRLRHPVIHKTKDGDVHFRAPVQKRKKKSKA